MIIYGSNFFCTNFNILIAFYNFRAMFDLAAKSASFQSTEIMKYEQELEKRVLDPMQHILEVSNAVVLSSVLL